MKIAKSFEDFPPDEILKTITSEKIAKKLSVDLFCIHRDYISQGFKDYVKIYILDNKQDYEEYKRLEPYMKDAISEYWIIDDGFRYEIKNAHDNAIIIIGKLECFDED